MIITSLNKTASNYKEEILAKTNGGKDVFHHYLPEFKEDGKVFLSPFREEKNPSANIFRAINGTYLYMDFTENKATNCFDFIIKKFGLMDLKAAIQMITNDMNLLDHKFTYKISSNHSNEFWSVYIDKTNLGQYLEKYEIFSWDNYTIKGKKVLSNASEPIYAFKISNECYKIYRPNSKQKHLWLGEKPSSFHNVWGLNQLPEQCKTILITEGYKDALVANARLNMHNIYAVGLDNAATTINDNILKELRNKCNNLILCMDIDEIGLKSSSKNSEKHRIKNLILPDILKESGGKDISDWFKYNLDKKTLLDAIDAIVNTEVVFENYQEKSNSILNRLLDQEKELLRKSMLPITPAPILISYNDAPIVKIGTINVVQGKFGSHKSRLAEGITSLLLSKPNNSYFLGFENHSDSPLTVAYIDTERNSSEEFPAAIKYIKFNIKHQPTDNVFRVTSIKKLKRSERLKGIKEFIESIRFNTSNSIVAVIDVVTDCIGNFNDPEESMELFDFFGNVCENYGATIILVIHENPNSEKSRGHVGTEATNKASSVLRVGYDRNRNGEESDLIKLSFIKLRAAKKPDPIYLEFDPDTHSLKQASADSVKKHKTEIDHNVKLQQLATCLSSYITEEKQYLQQEVVEHLTNEFDISSNTAKNRLQELEKSKHEILNVNDSPCLLKSTAIKGKPTLYTLVAMDIEEVEI